MARLQQPLIGLVRIIVSLAIPIVIVTRAYAPRICRPNARRTRRARRTGTRRPGCARRQRRAAQQHFDPRQQLAHRERLAQIVVRADLQSQHAIELVLARRHEDDRKRFRSAAQPPAQLQSVEPGQADVEDDQIRQRGVERRPGVEAIREALHLMSLLSQREAHCLADRVLVLDDRDARAAAGIGSRIGSGIRHDDDSTRIAALPDPPRWPRRGLGRRSHNSAAIRHIAAIVPPARRRASPLK